MPRCLQEREAPAREVDRPAAGHRGHGGREAAGDADRGDHGPGERLEDCGECAVRRNCEAHRGLEGLRHRGHVGRLLRAEDGGQALPGGPRWQRPATLQRAPQHRLGLAGGSRLHTGDDQEGLEHVRGSSAARRHRQEHAPLLPRHSRGDGAPGPAHGGREQCGAGQPWCRCRRSDPAEQRAAKLTGCLATAPRCDRYKAG
mmetsp:Transcript_56633/g.165636  ORF Transcript_56633/g.165636 Transcript_56633/m.165636 type:complete len:201 (+) Transcript_56633:703-1305(+)